tara:strand:+ start:899 stop:1111 length:213 start_codon:yes stop_codon:yes gene_type:complete
MSNTDLKPVDYSNTVLVQNSNNASVVSVFPLVAQEINETIVNESVVIETSSIVTTPTVPQTVSGGGGSGY